VGSTLSPATLPCFVVIPTGSWDVSLRLHRRDACATKKMPTPQSSHLNTLPLTSNWPDVVAPPEHVSSSKFKSRGFMGRRRFLRPGALHPGGNPFPGDNQLTFWRSRGIKNNLYVKLPRIDP